MVAHLLVMPHTAAIHANTSSAAEQAATDSGDENTEEWSESPCKRPRQVADEDADEKDADNRDSEDNNCDLLAGGDSTITNNKKQVFWKTYTHRDDWLHRGHTLCDMDYYHCAHYIERVELPLGGGPDAFLKKVSVYHHLTSHYALASTHVQKLQRKPKTVQNVSPPVQTAQCQQWRKTQCTKRTTTPSCNVPAQGIALTR